MHSILDSILDEKSGPVAGGGTIDAVGHRVVHGGTIEGEAALIDDLKAWSYVFRGSPRMRTTIVLTTHRPQDLPTHLRAVADVWCLFRTTQEHDLKVIEARCGADVARLVQDLKPYHFVSWNDAKGVLREHHTPETWFTPGPMPFEDTGKPFSSKATGLF